MANIDKRDRLKASPFGYKIMKSNIALIFYEKRQNIIQSEKDTAKLKAKTAYKSEHEVQLVLAKLTGHFKHRNEQKRPDRA